MSSKLQGKKKTLSKDKVINRTRLKDDPDVATNRDFKITIIDMLKGSSGKGRQYA